MAPVLLPVLRALAALKVTAPLYVCKPVVVTLAPSSLVSDTLKEAALLMAALRSSAPVMAIAPKALVAPTVSAVPSPNTAVPAPKLKVSA